MSSELHDIARQLLEQQSSRTMVAIAGAPASGKSTLADQLQEVIDQIANEECAVVLPMDGFHLDNMLLDEDHARDRKGASHTFDFDGLHHMLQRVAAAETEVIIPTFDRALDLARAGARRIRPKHRIVIVEGNYLLLALPPWQQLHSLFHYRIFLDVPETVLLDRLQQRWLDHDHSADEAMSRAQSNDIPNARQVIDNRLPEDRVLTLEHVMNNPSQ